MGLIKSSTKLFPHQHSQVLDLIKHRKVLFAEKTGKGKTLTCLYAFSVLKEHNRVTTLLVFTPLSAYKKEVWKKDIVKFTNLKYIDLESLYERICNYPDKVYDIIAYYDVIYAKHSHFKQVKYAELINEILNKFPKSISVIDECHAFKNPKSKLTILARMYLRNSYGLWGLTATPLSKNLEDTYNIVNFIRPWFFGTFPTFVDKYCTFEEKCAGRYQNGSLKKVKVLTGVKNEQLFEEKLAELPVIKGGSVIKPNFSFIDYELSEDEARKYKKIAKGIDFDSLNNSKTWIKKLLHSSDNELNRYPIKKVEKYSSRFIYLQSAADGILDSEGNQDRQDSTKMTLLINNLKSIVSKRESVLVYFDYYSAESVAKSMIKKYIPEAHLLESTGEHVLSDSDLTEAKCKSNPYIVLCTKASSESTSLYFIKNIIMFHIPTTPSVFVQFIGRITRINSLYPNDLQVKIFRSNNIDLYKLQVVSIKSYQMELVSGKEANIPDDLKCLATKRGVIEKMKKALLWNTR